LDFEIISEKMTEVYNSMKRPQPLMFKECPDSLKKLWLCDPKSRKNDLCITGVSLHRCNGSQTEILTYVLPEPCPNCDISSEDPVIDTRATSMQIIAKYKISSCSHCEETHFEENDPFLDHEGFVATTSSTVRTKHCDYGFFRFD